LSNPYGSPSIILHITNNLTKRAKCTLCENTIWFFQPETLFIQVTEDGKSLVIRRYHTNSCWIQTEMYKQNINKEHT